ncbi:MAG TPA: glycosyltransferase [Dokdonella sp.]|uniref:glycosyltransferase n=1 Tax=Dokdonella sp. TaxID=2291710 RepID=UPI002D805F04|nr:glycosyltransferase [Dokdonella sp.]HET9032957.1 glycosyltransferase [Dokdonella sp.]
MKVAILIPVLTSKDAVGADALAMAAILDESGLDTRIFCNSSTGVRRKTWPAEELNAFAGGPNDLVIYHFSTGWPAAVELLKRCRGYRVIKYHNITPSRFFEPYSAEYHGGCEKGRRELATVANLGCELYLGDSAYNLAELVEVCKTKLHSGILPPFHRVEELVAAEADTSLVDALTDGAKNFLMVGRVAPNKGHLNLIDAFSAYVRGYAEPARLLLVGKIDARLQTYTDSIRQRIDALGLADQVLWIDAASEAQLKAAYISSHVFMLMSEHEGFCVPLIESMALATPIVAHASSAVPETLGDAGIAWDEQDPWLYAASAARLFGDDQMRADLLECGRRRYQENFANEVLRKRFLGYLEPVL